ncbi:MAG: hypothetical protein WC937_01175 [Candidatus Omnitrophota bacterium]|jgi:hypothetical protein|nr:hypothetical protein [Candidatus Omnitrophota bacterium]MDD5518865.1 hypothetical protein [Candidatus Omnitrophota bacterium]
MVKKGLCNTCANGRGCVLPQKFPVWQCEEFNNCVVVIEGKQDKVERPRRGLR